jgi:membrane-associated phospholipid phosphatase
MALDLFKRSEARQGLFAVEKATIVYTLLTSLFILCLYDELKHPVRMLLERAFIVVLTLLVARLYRLYPCKGGIFARVTLQLTLLSYWYPETYEFNRLFPNLDHLFASAEQWLTGSQPSMWLADSLPYKWVSEALNLGYFFFYPMIILITVWYFVYRYEWFEQAAFVILMSFFVYYILFIFIPVAGPQFYFPAIGAHNVAHGTFPAIGDYFHHDRMLRAVPSCYPQGFFHHLVTVSQHLGERPTAAFPSSHVGISTILMILARRHAGQRLFAFLLPFYLLLCFATVYIRAHYVVDVLVGFLSGILLYLVSTWTYKRWLAPARG